MRIQISHRIEYQTTRTFWNLFVAATIFLCLGFLPSIPAIASHDGIVAMSGCAVSANAVYVDPYLPVNCDLQSAIAIVPDGGYINLRTDVVHFSPASTSGFIITNEKKTFTIQGANNGLAILSGNNDHPVVRFMNTLDFDAAHYGVTFIRIIIKAGHSATDGYAAGVTMQNSRGTFVDTQFLDNAGAQPTSGGGAVTMGYGSVATFSNTLWSNNTDRNYGGGLAVNISSKAYVNNSRFINNRTNVPYHLETAAGGAIHVGQPSWASGTTELYVTNSHFLNNQAGYVGGAIYGIGEWAADGISPRTYVLISSSYFTGNQAIRDTSVVSSLHTEAGAVHIEAQATGDIGESWFTDNSAEIGGGVNVYQGVLNVSNSYFKGNRAVGIGQGNGFGGAISATSNDTPAADGTNNRRSASVTLKDSLIIGGGVVAQTAGGFYIAGDSARTYGLYGVSQKGALSDNRAVGFIENVVFVNTDVTETAGVPGTGVGGVIVADLTALTVNNSLIINSNAFGTGNSSGGGAAFLDQSLVNIHNSTFANNTVGLYGAAIFGQGSELHLQNIQMVENRITGQSQIFGSALFTTIDGSRQLAVTGSLENSIVSHNVGMPLFDDDRTNGPNNEMRYTANQIYTNYNGQVYWNSIASYCCKTVADLNGLVISRANGSTTQKSMLANSSLSNPTDVATLKIWPSTDHGNTMYYLAYAWSSDSNSAQLDGQSVSTKAGLIEGINGGITHTLSVGLATATIHIKLLNSHTYLPMISR